MAGGESINFMGLDMSFFTVRHPVQCNAVKIAQGGKTFVYSGDMNTTPGFEGFASAADLLLMDGCFPAAEWNEGLPHLSALLAAGIGSGAQARRLVLTHVRPVQDEPALLEEARRAFPGAELAAECVKYSV